MHLKFLHFCPYFFKYIYQNYIHCFIKAINMRGIANSGFYTTSKLVSLLGNGTMLRVARKESIVSRGFFAVTARL